MVRLGLIFIATAGRGCPVMCRNALMISIPIYAKSRYPDSRVGSNGLILASGC